MYADKISFIIYMITTSLCIIALCIFLIKYIKKIVELEKIQNELIRQLKRSIKFDGILDNNYKKNKR